MEGFEAGDAGEEAARLAGWFAGGGRRVAAAFEEEWSYGEDKLFWEMETFDDARARALHPRWAPVLHQLARDCDQPVLDDLIEVLSRNYFHYADRLLERLESETRREWIEYAFDAGFDAVKHAKPQVEWLRRNIAEANYYNPFCSDLVTAARLADERAPSASLAELHRRVRAQAERLKFVIAYPGLPEKSEDHDLERNPYHLRAIRKQSPEEREPVVREWEHALLDKSIQRRWDCMRWLAIVEPRRAAPLLARCVRDRTDPDRGAAIYELGETGVSDPEGVAALIECVRDRNDRPESNRSRAVTALGRLGAREAKQPLLDYLSEESNPERERAALALGALGCREAILSLVALLERRWGDHRWLLESAWTLVRIGGGEVAAALSGALIARDPNVVRAAGEVLAEIGGQQAIAALLAGRRVGADRSTYGFVYYAHARWKRQRLGIPEVPKRRPWLDE